jgi:hypothetical protein
MRPGREAEAVLQLEQDAILSRPAQSSTASNNPIKV